MNSVDQLLFCGGERACGERDDGGLYACCPVGTIGQPLEHFVLDPARPFDGEPFRAPMFAERSDGYYDLVIWVGEGPYPFAPDVLEEGRTRGFSRRVPAEGGFDLLTPGQSRMILVHPKAIATPTPELPESVWCKRKGEDHACTFHLWPLSALGSKKGHLPLVKTPPAADAPGLVEIRTPSAVYTVPYYKELEGREIQYQPGAVVALPLSHFEYVNKQSNEVPAKVAEKVFLAGYQTLVCKE